MKVTPESFTRALADSTRLRILMMLRASEELCVCDLTAALALPQPKVSRHLAVLREAGILRDRRAGLWIHYRLHPQLPSWCLDAMGALSEGCAGAQPYEEDRIRLAQLRRRPADACG